MKICRLFFASILSSTLFVFPVSTSRANTIYHPRPKSNLHWHLCQDGHPESDCALLAVPLNYQHPHDGTIDIGISRLKAIDPHERIGTLFVNEGGPGASGDEGLSLIDGIGIKNTGHYVFSKNWEIIRHHFGIIGFDPRGVPNGRGDRVHCQITISEPQISLPPTQEDYRDLAAYNHAMSQSCQQQIGGFINNVDTRSVADDIDSIRKTLGEKTISYYGNSYGTEIDELYAEKYPSHLRAMALASPTDHSISIWQHEENRAQIQEDALRFFDHLCEIDSHCQIPNKNIILDLRALRQAALQGKLRTHTGEKIRYSMT